MPGSTRILRERMAATQDALDSSLDLTPPDAVTAILVKTKTIDTYPTGTNNMVACSPVGIDGDENEGAPASLVVDSGQTLFAILPGSAPPPEGTVAVAVAVGGRSVLAGTSGGEHAYYIKTPGGGVPGATGTWPSLTPGSATADVYVVSGSSMSLAVSSATIKNWFPSAAAANRVTRVIPDGSSAYTLAEQSCG